MVVLVYGLVHAVSEVLYKKKMLDTYSVIDDPLVVTKKQ
jgi:hypothetical protein